MGTTGCASTSTKESLGEYIDDTVITTKVKAALFADKAVSGFAVKVVTYKGVVQLSGFVDTVAEKQQAAKDALAVKGVSSVENNITVKNNECCVPQVTLINMGRHTPNGKRTSQEV